MINDVGRILLKAIRVLTHAKVNFNSTQISITNPTVHCHNHQLDAYGTSPDPWRGISGPCTPNHSLYSQARVNLCTSTRVSANSCPKTGHHKLFSMKQQDKPRERASSRPAVPFLLFLIKTSFYLVHKMCTLQNVCSPRNTLLWCRACYGESIISILQNKQKKDSIYGTILVQVGSFNRRQREHSKMQSHTTQNIHYPNSMLLKSI